METVEGQPEETGFGVSSGSFRQAGKYRVNLRAFVCHGCGLQLQPSKTDEDSGE